jgi:DNA-binding XRE family transcriptional regulator
MGKDDILVIKAPLRRRDLPRLPPDMKRRRPRAYFEWKTLRGWGKLPYWEGFFPGYLLREARERAGLTRKQMAERLGCSPQTVARAERPVSNPRARFLEAWAHALGMELRVALELPDETT